MNYFDDFDFERLRDDLMNYIGTATNIFDVAQADLVRIVTSNEGELLSIAQEFNIDLSDYYYKKIR